MMSADQHTVEGVVGSFASKATYAGAGSAVLGWFTSSEFGVVFGVIAATAGIIINWYYKAKQDKRHQSEHEARMRAIENGELL